MPYNDYICRTSDQDMEPFLKSTAEYLVTHFPDNLSDICIVLPNRRGGLFLRKYLAEVVGRVTWAPQIFSIEDFISTISGMQELDSISLIFEFYQVHLEIETVNPQSFEEFLKWAPQVLSDFNEIDRYQASTSSLFSTLTEARAIMLWNVDGKPLTDFEKRYLQFYQSLHTYYLKLTSRLITKNMGYQGLIFRKAAEGMAGLIPGLRWKHIIFVGFNALTTTEENIIYALKSNGLAIILWDADRYYLENPQQEAGDFLRSWFRKWSVTDPLWVFDHFAESPKIIDITGSPDLIGQVKYCGRLLNDLAAKGFANEKTAVVLLDEGLLIPLLNSIPDQIDSVNITAGMPLLQTPLADLFETMFKMHLNTLRFSVSNSVNNRNFYYKDVLKLLQNPYVQLLANLRLKANNISFSIAIEKIRTGNQVFLSMDDLIYVNAGNGDSLSFLEIFLTPWKSAFDATENCIAIIEYLRLTTENNIDLEYLFAFSGIFQQLANVLSAYELKLSLNVLYDLYRQVIATTTLPFYGEPMKGIQIMGMLETRTLDFDNLIILSCNDDLLPGGKSTNSYIPFDIKRSFGLPTYKQKDAVYAYHFYRLLQRAGHVWLLYNMQPGELGGGERSRFIRQIINELPRYSAFVELKESVIKPSRIKAEFPESMVIPKTGAVIDALVERAKHGFSASSLNAYRNCPLKFYYSEIQCIKEPDELTEEIDPAVLGSAIHEALYSLYKPHLNQIIDNQGYKLMISTLDQAVDSAFASKFKGSELVAGKNLLLVKVARMLIHRFLKVEADKQTELSSGRQALSVVMLEQYLERFIAVPFSGNDQFEVKIKGFIDRVDRLDGLWRIIDYKTGTTAPKQLKISEWERLQHDPDLNIAFQLLLYCYLLINNLEPLSVIQAGIFSLKTIATGFQPVSFPSPETGKSLINVDQIALDQFEKVLQTILREIFDLSLPFCQTQDRNICRTCPYINLCGR